MVDLSTRTRLSSSTSCCSKATYLSAIARESHSEDDLTIILPLTRFASSGSSSTKNSTRLISCSNSRLGTESPRCRGEDVIAQNTFWTKSSRFKTSIISCIDRKESSCRFVFPLAARKLGSGNLAYKKTISFEHNSPPLSLPTISDRPTIAHAEMPHNDNTMKLFFFIRLFRTCRRHDQTHPVSASVYHGPCFIDQVAD